MSRILALDASTDACSVALMDNGVVVSLFEQAAKSHTQRLLPMVDQILSAQKCILKDLDAIAFGRGPGSFTGLRICLGVVQGLAFGANKPVIGVSTLEAMARSWWVLHGQNKNTPPLLVTLDARMDEVYAGVFEVDADGVVHILVEEQVVSAERLMLDARLCGFGDRLVAIGPGLHYPAFEQSIWAIKDPNFAPDAAQIVEIAAVLLTRGETVSAFEAEPVYLRNEVSWKKRQRIRKEAE